MMKDFEKTIMRHVKMIKFIGLNLLEDPKNISVKERGKYFTLLISLSFMIVSQIFYIVKDNEKKSQFLEVVSTIPSMFLAIQDCLIAIVLFINRRKIRKIIHKIDEVWPVQIESEHKITTINDWMRHLDFFGNSFYRAAIICLFFFELEPLVMMLYGVYKENVVEYQFPVPMYYFGFLTSHFNYAFIYIYQCVVVSLAHMFVYIPSSLLLVDFIYNLSALLSLLKLDLENLESSVSEVNFQNDDSLEDIKSIVVLHQKLLSIADDINEIFGAIIFFQITCFSIIICCYGFMALIAEGMFLKYLTSTLGILFSTFILSWPGQVLVNTSSDISNAAYHCRWYKRGKKFRQCITIILIRSQTPCYLSAMGFSNITLAMFTKIISTSWSYLSLLNQMFEDFDF